MPKSFFQNFNFFFLVVMIFVLEIVQKTDLLKPWEIVIILMFYLICVGVDVSENILTGIYASRKTIVVMSENFLRSVWGQSNQSQNGTIKIFTKKDTLILIKHDKCKVPRKLMGKTFLDWACYKERPYFWKRLFQSIKVENQRAEESVP
ncbi:hypothetical protein KUTeg_015722 [Tegillarca granosa]|uniref:TIR domain-containing protein n=1 Tax=Tegillarca granosa TaxID=220873 RepID=A0ABQ9EN49_TEGGR|nr:hypothetical protein KUTeg_015722 [Tegillarca granosa]